MYVPSQVSTMCYDTSRCLGFFFSSSCSSHWQSAVMSQGCLLTNQRNNLFLITFLQVNSLMAMSPKNKIASYGTGK